MPGEPDTNTSALAGLTAMTIVGSALHATAISAALAAAGHDGIVVSAIDAPEADANGTDATAERTRVLALVDLCPETSMSTSLRTAVETGTTAGDFANGLAQAAKGRGASMEQLRTGAVSAEQLPVGGKAGSQNGVKPPTGQARGAAIVARAAAMGHKAVAHLAPKG